MEKKTNRTAGTRSIFADVSAELAEQWRAFLDSRPESARDHLEYMMRKHLANPPSLGKIPRASRSPRGRPISQEVK